MNPYMVTIIYNANFLALLRYGIIFFWGGGGFADNENNNIHNLQKGVI